MSLVLNNYREEQPQVMSVVVPALNEAANLPKLLREISQVFEENLGFGQNHYEIIVVDDGSTDQTIEVLDKLKSIYPLKVVSHKGNQGYGMALRTGFKEAQSSYVAFIDGDGQLNPSDFCRLFLHASKETFSIGYREVRNDSLYRRILGSIFSKFFVPIFIGVRIKDVDCALKIIPASFFKLVDLKSTGALINAEMLCAANKLGYKIIQTPVEHRSREFGNQSGGSPRVILKALYELFKVRSALRACSSENKLIKFCKIT